MAKKRLVGIIAVVLLTAILSFTFAQTGLRLVDDASTFEIDESDSDTIDTIVLTPPSLNTDLVTQPSASSSPLPSASSSSDYSSDSETAQSPQSPLLPLSSESESSSVSGDGSGAGGISSREILSIGSVDGEGIGPLTVEELSILDSSAPISMVVYFTDTDLTDERRDCEDENGTKKAYLNYNDVVGHGISEDNNSRLNEVQTKLDSNAPNNAVCSDGSCNEKSEDWHTGTIYFNLAEGWHTLFGRATDRRSNNESFNAENSCMFCIDLQSPGQPVKPVVERLETCDPLFAGDDPMFSWDVADEGCAGVSFFDVFIQLNRSGVLIEREMQTDDSMIKIEDSENADMIRIRVRAHDKSGNTGEWSEFSEWILVDTREPEVELLNTNENEWIMGDLEILENDSDENLFKCFYKIRNNGTETVPWTETLCNQPFTVHTSEVCPVDGRNECIVFKKAQDKACNEKVRSKQFDIDNHGPELTKIVGEPSSHEGLHVRKHTPITIIAHDPGVGVNETCYNFTNLQTGFTEERCSQDMINFTFWDNESQHDLMFWSTDLLGKVSRMNQTHFVDETPPMTMKNYTMLLSRIGTWVLEEIMIDNFMIDWIGPETKIILNATDKQPHPSGIGATLFKVFELGEDDHTEWYGRNNRRWYDEREKCEMENRVLNQVFRVEGNGTALSDDLLEKMVFATAIATPHDPFKLGLNPLGPFAKGSALGFTLGDWLDGSGEGFYKVNGSTAMLNLTFNSLVPDGVYTVWCSRLTFPPNASIVDMPCGEADGSENSFTAGEDGDGEFMLDLPTLPQTNHETATVVALAYHSDGNTHGESPGDFGLNSHVQIFSIIPRMNISENESMVDLHFVNHIQSGFPEQDVFIEREEGEMCVAVSGWSQKQIPGHESWDNWQILNDSIMIPEENEGAHKICFKSRDNVWNLEDKMCQVFFVDNEAPRIEPFALPDHQCQKSVTARINDDESGVKAAWVEWIKQGENQSSLRRDMTFFRDTGVWDATFLANDLGNIMEGNYTVRISAEDYVGNVHHIESMDHLMKTVCVVSISPRQCTLDSSTGGNCMFNFNVLVRGGNAVQMGMDNLFGLSPQNISAVISNSFGSRAVGNDMLWNGGILQISNSSNRGSFKLNLDIPATVTGEEILNYFLRPEMA